MKEGTPILTASDLRVGYGEPGLFGGLDLSLAPGGLTCLLGPNGVGKTTLLRTLAGLQRPLGGAIYLDGRDLAAYDPRGRARRLGVVLTQTEPAVSLRVGELVALGRYPHTGWTGGLGANDLRVVREVMEMTGVGHLAGRPVGEISDGERQRVLVARVLAQETPVLILDEPTAFLDLPSRAGLMGLLRRLSRERSLAVLLSTHDLALSIEAADTLWVLEPGGALRAGFPEDLMVAGHLERVFSGKGFVLNSGTASFRLDVPQIGSVSRIDGPEPARTWMGHALRRHGIGEGGDAGLRVDSADGIRWTCRAGGETVASGSIGEVVWGVLESVEE